MDQPTVEPLITVVLPVRDRADLLPRTLRSIQHQTLRPLRVVIADNGSTDAAPRIIAEWKERVAPEGISVKIVSEPRPGAARARNAALAMVDTPFTLHFDSDDEMLPDHLAQVDAWLRQHPDTDLLRWDVSILDDDGWTTLKGVGKRPACCPKSADGTRRWNAGTILSSAPGCSPASPSSAICGVSRV